MKYLRVMAEMGRRNQDMAKDAWPFPSSTMSEEKKYQRVMLFFAV
jgi:hypothetical protein